MFLFTITKFCVIIKYTFVIFSYVFKDKLFNNFTSVKENKMEIASTDNFNNLPSLDRYLYDGLNLSQILTSYISDLKVYGKKTSNIIELEHASFLEQYQGIIEDDSFVFEVEKDMESFLKLISNESFSYVLYGRIKSLLRLEEKFNGYIQEAVSLYVSKSDKYKSEHDIQSFVKKYLQRFRDSVAFRIIISSKSKDSKSEIAQLSWIANKVCDFFSSSTLNFVDGQVGRYKILPASRLVDSTSSKKTSIISKENRLYFKDYVDHPKKNGYSALHVSMVYEKYNRPIELQLLTFSMLSKNEHEISSHQVYEKEQKKSRMETVNINETLFEESHERIIRQESLDYKNLNVSMLYAKSNDKKDVEDFSGLVNDLKLTPFKII